MLNSPDPSGHMRTQTSLAEPPSARLVTLINSRSMRSFRHTTIQYCAYLQRLHFGGVYRLRSTLESGEHHG